jgi:hypothetical protein
MILDTVFHPIIKFMHVGSYIVFFYCILYARDMYTVCMYVVDNNNISDNVQCMLY